MLNQACIISQTDYSILTIRYPAEDTGFKKPHSIHSP